MNERLEATVSGRVQLVMYRDFVQRGARALGLTGYVKNMSDGTVLVVAEGARDKLEALIARLHRGSLFSRVDAVEIAFVPHTGTFKSFSISYV
jgi:acylphosphatase